MTSTFTLCIRSMNRLDELKACLGLAAAVPANGKHCMDRVSGERGVLVDADVEVHPDFLFNIYVLSPKVLDRIRAPRCGDALLAANAFLTAGNLFLRGTRPKAACPS